MLSRSTWVPSVTVPTWTARCRSLLRRLPTAAPHGATLPLRGGWSRLPTRRMTRDHTADSGSVHRVGIRSDPATVVEFGDGGHIVSGEFEIEHVEVLCNSRGRHGLWDDNIAQLHVPAQHDLCRRLPVLLR